MFDRGRLLHGAKEVAALQDVTFLRRGHEFPGLFPGERRYGNASGDGVAGKLADLRQRTLDAVVDAFQHARSQFDGQRIAGRFDRCAGSQSGGLFIDLDGGAVARHIQDLADQVLFADPDDVRDVGVRQTVGHDQRTGYFYNFSAHI